MDFSIVKAAGLTQGELAHLCGVSRQTAGAWMKGTQEPHTHCATIARRVLTELTDACAAGRLPVGGNVPRVRAESGHTIRPDALQGLTLPFE